MPYVTQVKRFSIVTFFFLLRFLFFFFGCVFVCEQHMIADRFVDSGHHGTSEESSSFLLTAFFFCLRACGRRNLHLALFFFYLMAFSRILLPLFLCLFAFLLFLFYFIDSAFYLGKSAIRVS